MGPLLFKRDMKVEGALFEKRKGGTWEKSNQCMIYIHENVIIKLTILYNENVLIFKNDL